MKKIEDNFLKFETCKFRSKEKIIKKKCCGSGFLEGYACLQKKIYPLSPIRDCQKCESFSKSR